MKFGFDTDYLESVVDSTIEKVNLSAELKSLADQVKASTDPDEQIRFARSYNAVRRKYNDLLGLDPDTDLIDIPGESSSAAPNFKLAVIVGAIGFSAWYFFLRKK